MKNRDGLLSLIKMTSLIAILGVGLYAEAGLFGLGGGSWEKKGVLHDGSRSVLTPSPTYWGRHENGEPSPVKEHTITLTPPPTNKTHTWTSQRKLAVLSN